MLEEAPWEDYHHHYNKDYSNDLNHPSVFDFLSNTINTVDTEDNSYLVLTSLKMEQGVMTIVILLSQPH